jgi:transaldolase
VLLRCQQMKQYQHLVEDAIAYGTKNGTNEAQKVELAMDKYTPVTFVNSIQLLSQLSLLSNRLAVNFGVEITKIVPGVVSTEVDAR